MPYTVTGLTQNCGAGVEEGAGRRLCTACECVPRCAGGAGSLLPMQGRAMVPSPPLLCLWRRPGLPGLPPHPAQSRAQPAGRPRPPPCATARCPPRPPRCQRACSGAGAGVGNAGMSAGCTGSGPANGWPTGAAQQQPQKQERPPLRLLTRPPRAGPQQTWRRRGRWPPPHPRLRGVGQQGAGGRGQGRGGCGRQEDCGAHAALQVDAPARVAAAAAARQAAGATESAPSRPGRAGMAVG